jgi:hypothetical protein
MSDNALLSAIAVSDGAYRQVAAWNRANPKRDPPAAMWDQQVNAERTILRTRPVTAAGFQAKAAFVLAQMDRYGGHPSEVSELLLVCLRDAVAYIRAREA